MPPRKRASTRAEPDGVELARLPAAAPLPPTQADEPSYVPQTVAEARIERELDDILGEIGGGDVRVKVSRFSESGAMQSCGEMSGDSFSMEALTDTFGGGKYLLRFFKGKAELDRTRVEVDALIPPRNPRAPKAAPGVAPQAPMDLNAVMVPLVTMMMTMMQNSQQGTAALISGMAEMMKSRAPERDPMEMAIRMAELMKQNPGGSPADLFSIFEKGMNVAAKLGGGSDDGVMPMVGEGVKGVVAMLEGYGAEKKAQAEIALARARSGIAPPPSAVVSSQQPPVAVVAAPPVEDSPAMSVRPWLTAALPHRAALAMMIGVVKPETGAQMILDVLDDDQLDDLLSDIEDPAEPGFVARAFAALRPGEKVSPDQMLWLSDVAAAVVASTESAAEEVPAAEGETRMTGDGGTGT